MSIATVPARRWGDVGGRSVYAVGDIHGRDDLLAGLLVKISSDVERNGMSDDGVPLLIFLGDYIDRGPGSRNVIDQLLSLDQTEKFDVRFLLGNHEQAMLDFLDRKTGGEGWMKHGGGATMLSYGVRPPKPGSDRSAWSEARVELASAIPDPHLRFYRNLELYIEKGGYIFVHAGVRPGVPLEAQEEKDLLWIRREFFDRDAIPGKTIVHGHTPSEQPYISLERIGIDTGAYLSGILTGIRLDGDHPVVLSYSGHVAPQSLR